MATLGLGLEGQREKVVLMDLNEYRGPLATTAINMIKLGREPEKQIF